MNTSETINELATALAKAQGQIMGAVKDTVNPHFGKTYADLASVWDACRVALTSNGLSVLQAPRGVATAGGWVVEVETRLMHSSGQWIADTITVPVGKPDAQGLGSACTYARRYSLAAFVGVAPEDDDGNAASSGVTMTPRTYTDTRTGEISDAPAKANGAALMVTKVESKPTKKPGTTRYAVCFSNGTWASTISDRLGAIAQELCDNQEVILPPITKQSAYGTDLVEIHRKSAATVMDVDSDGVPTPDDKDLPF